MPETKYFVIECYRHADSHNWEYRHDGMFSDLSLAKNKLHERGAAIMKSSNDFAMVMLVDSWGTTIEKDFINTYEEPEPEEEEEPVEP